MNVINTVAPISIENLKKYFADKTTSFVIDYDNSSLKGEKLLTYLSNLDIPSDISFDPTNQEHLDLFKTYLVTGFIAKVPSLEYAAIDCLFEFRKIYDTKIYAEFIKNNTDIIKEWAKRLDSLTLFNVYSVNVNEFKDWVKNEHVEDTSDASTYVNFINLIQHEEFYDFYLNIDKQNLTYYSKLFNDYCFKGSNLYTCWANPSNPMFLLTYGISTGEVSSNEYLNNRNSDINDLEVYDL